MRFVINPAYAHCASRNCFVSLEQTESECRERHNCSDATCPLEKEFGHNRFSKALGLLAAGFGQTLDTASRR